MAEDPQTGTLKLTRIVSEPKIKDQYGDRFYSRDDAIKLLIKTAEPGEPHVKGPTKMPIDFLELSEKMEYPDTILDD